MKRTYNEIMHDIYNTDCLKVVNDCRKEIVEIKHSLTLNKLVFAFEKIQAKTAEIAIRDGRTIKGIIGID